VIWRHVNQIGSLKAMQTFAGPYTEEIARRAYELWEQRGRPNGSREEDWFRAESELSHPSEVLPAETAADKDLCEFTQR
jgi:hypothetical protein